MKTPCEGITKQKLVLNHLGFIGPCKYNDQKNALTHINKNLIFSPKWSTASCSQSIYEQTRVRGPQNTNALEAGERQLAKSPDEKLQQLSTPAMMAKNSTYSEGYDGGWGRRHDRRGLT